MERMGWLGRQFCNGNEVHIVWRFTRRAGGEVKGQLGSQLHNENEVYIVCILTKGGMDGMG